MKEIYIPVILGTAREGRHSASVAQWVFSLLQNFQGVTTQLIDVRDFVLQPKTIAPWMEGESSQPWQDLCTRADGFVIVSPEYNHSFPGELKLLLDQAEKEYQGKPVGICSVSAGGFGGIRLIQALLPVFHTLELKPLKTTLSISNVQKIFSEGKLMDTSYEEKAKKFLEALTEEVWQYKRLCS